MRDLSALGTGEFDIVFHQQSLVFVPDADRVIAEVARILAPGGTVGAGSTITRDTEPGTLTVARGRQASIAGWKRPVKAKK